MANPRRSPTVRESIAAVEGAPGPAIEQYAIPLDRPVLFRWVPGDQSPRDGRKVLWHSGGTLGRWLEVRSPDKGPDLGDESTTIFVGAGEWRVLPSGTLTVPRTITLGTAGAANGDCLTITRLDTSPHVLTIANGGTAGNVLVALPMSAAWWVKAYFNGGDWLLREAGQVP